MLKSRHTNAPKEMSFQFLGREYLRIAHHVNPTKTFIVINLLKHIFSPF